MYKNIISPILDDLIDIQLISSSNKKYFNFNLNKCSTFSAFSGIKYFFVIFIIKSADIIISHDMTWHDMTWHDMTWHDMTWHDMTWHDEVEDD